MTPIEITQINWATLVEKNAGFAIAFAILLMGGFLAYFIVKAVAKQVFTLQDLIGNHMVSNAKALKELTMSIKEHRKQATERSNRMLERHDKVLEEIYKMNGKLGGTK